MDEPLLLDTHIWVWAAEWMEQHMHRRALAEIEIALESAALPALDDHADPADRVLLATARTLGARLVTCDERLLRYAERGHVLVLDARP